MYPLHLDRFVCRKLRSARKTLADGKRRYSGLIQNQAERISRQHESNETSLGRSDVGVYITGTGGDDVIEGLDGLDTLFGATGNDTLYGGAEYDELYGGDGDDSLDGGTGYDWMVGGNGNDTFSVDSTYDYVVESDTVPGVDLVIASVSFDLGGLYSAGVENLTLIGDAIQANGNNLNNVLIGNAANNILGDDTGYDTLYGGAGNDSLYGGADNDFLDGGTGADYMDGGTGDDTFVVDNVGDVVYDISGYDTVESSINYVLGTDIENLTLTGNATTGTGNALDNQLRGNSLDNVLSGLDGYDSIAGDAGSDTLNGGNGNDFLDGGAGNDALYGGADDDNMYGGDGNDLVVGGDGNDSLSGGFGDDSMSGGNDDDSMFGDDGNDTLLGGAGADALSGGNDNDSLDGGAGDDSVYGDAGQDFLTAGDGDDVLDGASGNDTLYAGAGADTLYGDIGNDLMLGDANDDLLYAGSGNDTLDGGLGADNLWGNVGNDTFIVDDLGDSVYESAGQGTDTVRSSVNFSLGGALLDVENLTLTGSAYSADGNSLNNVLIGNAANNYIIGYAGHDTLDGGAGNDSMYGGDGDDVYIVDNVNDLASESSSSGGHDKVYSSVTYGLSDNVEDLTLTGTAAINANGNTMSNYLRGNSGNNVLKGMAGYDTLDGGTGTDTLIGGADNDEYFTDGGDTITELAGAGEGFDIVNSSVSYVLGANLESLRLMGSADLNGTGNALNNEIRGNAGANVLNGMGGSDQLYGGLGDDIYIADSADAVNENAGEGTDLVLSSSSYGLSANVENLTLMGTAANFGNGNVLNNVLTGNAAANELSGFDGNDTLIGGAGNDSLYGGTGADFMNGGDGIDTAFYSSALAGVSVNLATGSGSAGDAAGDQLVGIENLTGSAYNDTLIGDANANVLTGLGGNDWLDGGTGADTMIGGLGNDLYTVDNVRDVVTEAAGEGIDIVGTSLSYVLGANIENLSLQGNGNINGTGNTLDNVLTGTVGNNLLLGLAGNDMIGGDAGNDTLIGGAGADTLYGGYGIDLVDYSASAAGVQVDLGTNSGTGGDAQGDVLSLVENVTGTAYDDRMSGDGAGNLLVGGAGNDTLVGGGGADTLVGGAGNDTYDVENVGDVVTEKANEGIDQVNAGVSYVLGANVENLTLYGSSNIDGTGNALNNIIRGASGDNVLNGGTGADLLIGGAGNDTYVTDGGDTIIEYIGEGNDTVRSSVTYTLGSELENLTLTGSSALNGTGNTLRNILTGNSANNILSGLAGDDTIYGGAGNDTIIGGTGGDWMYGGDGIDTADYSTASSAVYAYLSYPPGGIGDAAGDSFTSIENLRGSAYNDFLVGDAAANVITGDAGNDTLSNGFGGGADTLIGGVGDDLYYVYNTGVVVTELASGGTDTVNADVSYTLGANLENLYLLGSTSINGTGNALNNVISGNTGDNVLNGGTGSDTLKGDDGNDTYITDGGDTIIEVSTGGGIDLVLSSATFILGANIENLTLTGGLAINGTGNTDGNLLTGNAANNSLWGGDGADTLVGGAGTDALYGGVDSSIDVFVFNAVSDSVKGTGRDVIYDFGSGPDVIDLRLIDANAAVSGDQAFAFSGTNSAANSVWYATNGTGLIVYGDTNGDKIADFEIGMALVHSVVSVDFLL